MEELIKTLKQLKEKSKTEFRLEDVENIFSVYPFNKFEFIVSHLLAEKIITIDDYEIMREDYIKRNKFLHLFEITSPRGFGETWAQGHINELVPELVRPSRRLDPTFMQGYDLFYKNDKCSIRIEVKASRAVDSDSDEILVIKALSSDTKKCYNMNFQQLKPDLCDIFVWLSVWRDKIIYWVIPSNDIKKHPDYCKNQHTKGSVKTIEEGQLWITPKNIEDFNKYEVKSNELLQMILFRYLKQTNN